MQVSGTSSNYWLQQLQQDLAGFASSITGAASTGQTLPTSGQGSTASTSSASSTSPATTSTGSTQSLLGTSVLATLLGAQEQQSSQPSEATLANNVAGKIIASLDGGNSSGTLSLDQVASALSQASSTTVAPSSISAAFNQLDTNGDGQLSQSELASALETLAQTQQSQQASGTEPPHHHHHHHGADASQASSATSSDTTTASTTTTSAAASTTSTGSGT